MTLPRPASLAVLLAPCAALAGMPVAAHAQERDPFALRPPEPLLRSDVAGTRQLPGMAPAGIKAGPLQVFPVLAVRTTADSNVLSRTTDKRGDAAITISPALTATGASGKADYALSAEAGMTRYASLTSQNTETWGLAARVSLPLGKQFTLAAGGGWSRRAEPNYTAAAAALEGSATLYRQLEGDLALRADLGPLRITGSLGLVRVDYLPVTRTDGTVFDQSFRDQRSVTAGLKLEQALPGGRVLFAQGRYRWATSLHPLPCCDRSSTGGDVLGGVRTDLGHLFTAEVAGGYQWRTYRSPAFRSYRGAAWRARIEWYPTPLVSLSLTGRRDLIDSGVPAAAGAVVDSAALRIFYELRRDLNIVLTASITREKYRDLAPATGAGAHSKAAGIEARYALSNRYLIGAFARSRHRSADNALLPSLGSAVEGGLWLRLSL